MASTACGATFGVSSNCRLCSANIYDENGIFDESGIFDAFDHIRAKCRNDSESPCVAVIGHVRFNTEYNDAVAKMVADGVVVVTSAGNQARDAGTLSPASEPSVITVGATTDLDALLNTSNWGPFVDIYAPGSNITCAGLVNTTYFRTRSGTELAAARKFHFCWPHCEMFIFQLLTSYLLYIIFPKMSLGSLLPFAQLTNLGIQLR